MLKSLSSIFSFETLRLNGPPPAGFYKAILFTLAIVTLGEGVSRFLLAHVGRNWEYWTPEVAVQFEEYRHQTESGQSPEVLIIGDSTGLCDLDPLVISRCVPGGPNVYNLATHANFPFAFRSTTLPLLGSQHRVPRLVIASFSPDGFVDSARVRRFEEKILSSAYCRHSSGRFVATDYVSLLRLLNALPLIKSAYWGKRDSAQAATNSNDSPSIAKSTEGAGPSGARDEAEIESKEISSDRFSVVRELGILSKARGFKLLIVVPPRLTSSMDEVCAEYVRQLLQAKEDYGFTVLDASRSAFLSEVNFKDNAHLNQDGARIFSKELARTVVPVLLAAFETSVDIGKQAQRR